MHQPSGSAKQPIPGELQAFGWNQSVSERFRPFDGAGFHLARVMRVDRASCVIATSAGVAPCRAGPDLTPVTGDWIVVRDTSDGGLVLDRILERTTSVVRTNALATGEQVLVANVDTMFVLHGLDRPHRVGRLERLAILSWDAGVRPVIVLTKIDLADTDGAVIGVDAAVAEIDNVVFDIEVVAVSSLTGAGVDLLQPYLGLGQTIGLVGESGAGKSSLANRLAGTTVQSTGSTRTGDHKGRHTTTSRDLVPIPGGAALVDTPGLRSISMPSATKGLARAYADLESFADGCRFSDCSHEVEPDCGIQRALVDGNLTAERWAGYRKLQREMAFEAGRAAVRARQTESRSSRRRRTVTPQIDEW